MATSSIRKVVTEDLGKIFEMAICLLYNTPYDGKYSYDIEDAYSLAYRIQNFTDIFKHPLMHVAKSGNKYDFNVVDIENLHLSAKTTKKDGRVCPQVIGQPSKKKFCSYFGLQQEITVADIKQYIVENYRDMLPIYFEHTFDCPILYYNKHKDICLFVETLSSIEWNLQTIEFSHIKKGKPWNESSTISINGKTIGEFQIHNHRDGIKFRWAFENILSLFDSNFKITVI
jgi:hypothetical protein